MNHEKLKKEFEQQHKIRTNILDNITINFNYSNHLYSERPTRIINMHWAHFRHMTFKMLIIDSSKLFTKSKNQKYNFITLIEALEKGKYATLYICQNRTNEWKFQINRYSEFIETISYLRDKLFAHTDLQLGSHPMPEFFFKMRRLIETGYTIQNDIQLILSEQPINCLLDKTDLSDL